MNFKIAKTKLTWLGVDFKPDGSLECLSMKSNCDTMDAGNYICGGGPGDTITLDGGFDLETLEAIVTYMKGVK